MKRPSEDMSFALSANGADAILTFRYEVAMDQTESQGPNEVTVYDGQATGTFSADFKRIDFDNVTGTFTCNPLCGQGDLAAHTLFLDGIVWTWQP